MSQFAPLTRGPKLGIRRPGTYGYADFSTNRQAFISNAGGVITVVDGYGVWAARNGMVGGKTDDDDGNGRSNIDEFALGDHTPLCGMTPDGPRFTHARRKGMFSGVSYSVEVSDNLTPGSWSTNGIAPDGTDDLDEEFDAAHFRILTPTDPQKFFRLVIDSE